MQKGRRIAVQALAGLVFLCVVAVGGGLIYPLRYQGRIYPGVSVYAGEGRPSIDVGGLTADEATAELVEGLPDPVAQILRLRAGGQVWSMAWADVGQGCDYAATAEAAYRVGRQGRWYDRALAAWRLRMQGHRVGPIVVPADSDRVVALLDEIALSAAVPPVGARLQISPGGVEAAPGQTGRALDVEGSAARVMDALAESARTFSTGAEQTAEAGRTAAAAGVELVTVDVAPRLSEPEPAATLARSMLAQPFMLVADDPLTELRAEFAVPPERVATWLRAVPEYTEGTARMALEVDESAVRAWLEEIAPQLVRSEGRGAAGVSWEPERRLDLTETLGRVLAALDAGEHQAQARVWHPEGSYVVQPGDNFFDIAYSHGFPQWRLEEANPDVDPEALAIGMELVIPSIDVLFPHPLVPGKRIEISLPEQRLRAYEADIDPDRLPDRPRSTSAASEEQLVYDFTCSSGMTSTPTIAGQFQVLFKEPEAYASRWELTMPHFMGVFQEGPEFVNGIHELPITSYGQRLWEGVLGWPASYGCIILDIGDAETLYNWAPVGTLVRITGVAPGTPVYGEEDTEEQ